MKLVAASSCNELSGPVERHTSHQHVIHLLGILTYMDMKNMKCRLDLKNMDLKHLDRSEMVSEYLCHGLAATRKKTRLSLCLGALTWMSMDVNGCP